MAQIDNIIEVQIDRQTDQIDIQSFDIPLLLVGMTGNEMGTDRVRTYTGLDEVADDFGTTHNAYKMAQKLLSGGMRVTTFKIGRVDLSLAQNETYVAALMEVIDEDDTWYALMADDHSDGTIEPLAEAIQAMRKTYFTSTSSADAIEANSVADIGSKLFAKKLDRTIVMYHPEADEQFPECRWVGEQLTYVPGSNSWEYKSLSGVTVVKLSSARIKVLESKGYNYYIRIKGSPVTRRGKTSGNSWIDEIILVDWIYARLQEQIFFRMINLPKIPYTDEGVTIIENEIRSVLAQGRQNGGIDQFDVNSPRVLAIPEMQRAARIMGDFKFKARLAGAVSIVTIRGVVSY